MNKNNTEEETLRTLKAYELACIINNLKHKRIDEVKQEAVSKYGRSLLDLTEDEVKTLSIKARREYRWMLRWLIMEIGKYTPPTIIYVDTLNDLREKLEEFKVSYYKKNQKEKK